MCPGSVYVKAFGQGATALNHWVKIGRIQVDIAAMQ